MRPVPFIFATMLGIASAASAQSAAKPLPTAEQIAAAVTPLPPNARPGATVLGYGADGKLVTLRRGTNEMICLTPTPGATSFHSACYHQSMEPFMARGRELRAQGVKDPQVDTIRFAEVKTGKLKVPAQPAMLYQIFGGTFDAATGSVTGGRHLYVTYIPFATAASTGLSANPSDKEPWIMYPGTPKAHIMFATGM